MLKKFGENHFSNTVYFNFDEQPKLKQLFTATKDMSKILKNLAFVSGRKIDKDNTLIIFDEIQECNEALGTLKYFCEKAPEYAIVSAGSLFGVAMTKGRTFPVGKVDFIDIHPVTFYEFLSLAAPSLLSYHQSIQEIEPLPDIFFNQILEQFKIYFITGGMPESIVSYLETMESAF